MNRSTRPAYKHELLYFPPFVLTDRLETHQQAFVLLLGYRRYLVRVFYYCRTYYKAVRVGGGDRRTVYVRTFVTL